MNGLLAVLDIPNDRLAHARQTRESSLRKAGLLAVILNELREWIHLLLWQYNRAENQSIKR